MHIMVDFSLVADYQEALVILGIEIADITFTELIALCWSGLIGIR